MADVLGTLAHAQAVLDYSSPGTGRIATYLGTSGSYLAARDMWLRISDARAKRYGEEHVLTIIGRQEAAQWTGEAGDAGGARDLLKALMPALERLAGPETRRVSRLVGTWRGSLDALETQPPRVTCSRNCYPSNSVYLAQSTRTP